MKRKTLLFVSYFFFNISRSFSHLFRIIVQCTRPKCFNFFSRCMFLSFVTNLSVFSFLQTKTKSKREKRQTKTKKVRKTNSTAIHNANNKHPHNINVYSEMCVCICRWAKESCLCTCISASCIEQH